MLIALVAQSALAQRVSGRVHESGSGVTVAGAVVWLANAQDSSLRRVLSDSAGRFTMARPAGASVLHVVRIGFRARTVSLAPADTLVDIDLAPVAAQLASISTNESRVCPDSRGASRAFDLWDQARAALLAGVVARETQPPRLRLIAFDRTIDPSSHRVTHTNRTTREVVSGRAYVAGRRPAAFAVYGYLEEDGHDRVLFAPDDETLLHPSFAEHHCFHAIDADDSHPGQVGIAFEPSTPDLDTLVDVRGVLWIDRARPALRSLTFDYVGLEPAARSSGGEVYFATMTTGVEFVTRWVIRTALLATEMSEAERARSLPPRDARTKVRLTGIREVGGEIASARWPDGVEWVSTLRRITGQVVDTEGQPVAGGVVWVVDSPDTVRTDSAGHFALPSLPQGSYAVLATDSVLARAGIARTETAHVLLMEDRSSDIRLPFHSRDDVLQMMCKGQRYVAGQGVVLGRIQDQSGAPMASARIELWRRIVNKNVELFREEIAGEAGDDGRFVVCGTPRDQVLRVRASVNDASAETLTDSRADGLGVVVLTVHRKP